jgi:DNA-binding NtrC family response regulator
MRVLLIDDDEELRTAMATFFLGRGYEVQCAGEMEEAIAMIRHHRFDVVIVDLELNSIEGLNGFSVLKALRQSCPRTPVIIYSGHSSQTIKDAALRHGGARFMEKPQSLTRLLETVEELCPLPC